MNLTPLYRWVHANNPPAAATYRAGWWDYIATIYRLEDKYDVRCADVVGTYEVVTPPPSEVLTLPLVKLSLSSATAVIHCDFGRVVGAWVVRVDRSAEDDPIPLRELFPTASAAHPQEVSEWPVAVQGPPYAREPSAFAIALDDECDVDTLIRAVTRGRTRSWRQ